MARLLRIECKKKNWRLAPFSQRHYRRTQNSLKDVMHSLTVIRGTHYEVTYVCYEFIVGGSGFLTCFNANVSVARDICGSIDLMPSLYARRYHGCLCNPSVRLLYRSWRRPSVLAWSMRSRNTSLVQKWSKNPC